MSSCVVSLVWLPCVWCLVCVVQLSLFTKEGGTRTWQGDLTATCRVWDTDDRIVTVMLGDGNKLVFEVDDTASRDAWIAAVRTGIASSSAVVGDVDAEEDRSGHLILAPEVGTVASSGYRARDGADDPFVAPERGPSSRQSPVAAVEAPVDPVQHADPLLCFKQGVLKRKRLGVYKPNFFILSGASVCCEKGGGGCCPKPGSPCCLFGCVMGAVVVSLQGRRGQARRSHACSVFGRDTVWRQRVHCDSCRWHESVL